jgi:hypothetical protein
VFFLLLRLTVIADGASPSAAVKLLRRGRHRKFRVQNKHPLMVMIVLFSGAFVCRPRLGFIF